MAYSRTQWVNNLTPVNERNMNNIEDGIEEAISASSTNASDIVDLRTDMGTADNALSGRITAVDEKADGIDHDYKQADNALSGRVSTLEAHAVTYSDPDNDGNIVISILT